MQIKTTVRYHFTPVRMAIIKKTTHTHTHKTPQITTVGELIEERKRPLVNYWWERKLVQPLWEPLWRFLKNLKMRTIIWSSNSTSGYAPEETKALRGKDTCTQWSQEHYWQQPRYGSNSSAQNRWMEKEYVVCTHTHTMTYCSVIKKRTKFCHFNNMDGHGGYYTWWNKSGKWRQILYVKYVHFIVCKLYLNKVDLKSGSPRSNLPHKSNSQWVLLFLNLNDSIPFINWLPNALFQLPIVKQTIWPYCLTLAHLHPLLS